jgi:hypothetical protein
MTWKEQALLNIPGGANTLIYGVPLLMGLGMVVLAGIQNPMLTFGTPAVVFIGLLLFFNPNPFLVFTLVLTGVGLLVIWQWGKKT